jgi:phage protein D
MLNNTPSLPYFEVIINGTTRLTQWTPSVSIYQDINSHPIALLDVVYVGKNTNASGVGATNTWQYLKEDTPIQINYGQNPHYMYPFLGYVASYKLVRTGTDPGYAGQVTTRVQYTITGTSKVMQSTKNVAWKYTSPSTIAGNIATSDGFRGVIYNYVAAIDYRLQNSSDFKFLVQLAEEIGFLFFVDNTDLYFVNPKEVLDRGNNRGTPQFWSYNQPGLYDTIRSFTPIVGTITPDGGVVANRNVVGLNPNTQQLVQASSTPTITSSATSATQLGTSITKYYNAAPAESYYEASQKVQADALNNLYWNTANADLRGDARVKPNNLVNLIGTTIPTNDAGLWLVRSATHNLTKAAPSGSRVDTTYTTSAVLVRDQIYTATTTAIADTAPITQTVPATLVNGIWRSSNLGATVYAT